MQMLPWILTFASAEYTLHKNKLIIKTTKVQTQKIQGKRLKKNIR